MMMATAGTPVREVRFPMDDKLYTEKMLQDGSELLYLKKRFNEKKTKEQLDWLLACIRDSTLIVPLLPISHKPDLCEDDDGKRYLPAFSQTQQIPPDYGEEFDLTPMDFLSCVELARSMSDVVGIALDPFTDVMVLEHDLIEAVLRIPSRRFPDKE